MTNDDSTKVYFNAYLISRLVVETGEYEPLRIFNNEEKAQQAFDLVTSAAPDRSFKLSSVPLGDS